MLVLSRKKNEFVVLNDNIRVSIVEVRGDTVRLGFEAPKNVSIHREEVFDKIQRTGTTKRTISKGLNNDQPNSKP